jgi:protein-S-isoprenylcysteine O-methyltransferase Ste14
MTDITFVSIAFFLGAAIITWLSRKPLRHPGSHGFYRFFVWQGILILFIFHHPLWPSSALEAPKYLSSILMPASLFLVLAGWFELKRKGYASTDRKDEALFKFEKTTAVVSSGIFRYIRHPMYTSLLLLAWGAFCQRPTVPGIIVVTLTTLLLFLTARADERECQKYFGETYQSYKQKTWAFVPFVY